MMRLLLCNDAGDKLLSCPNTVSTLPPVCDGCWCRNQPQPNTFMKDFPPVLKVSLKYFQDLRKPPCRCFHAPLNNCCHFLTCDLLPACLLASFLLQQRPQPEGAHAHGGPDELHHLRGRHRLAGAAGHSAGQPGAGTQSECAVTTKS